VGLAVDGKDGGGLPVVAQAEVNGCAYGARRAERVLRECGCYPGCHPGLWSLDPFGVLGSAWLFKILLRTLIGARVFLSPFALRAKVPPQAELRGPREH
jgi:hypothetical protein